MCDYLFSMQARNLKTNLPEVEPKVEAPPAGQWLYRDIYAVSQLCPVSCVPVCSVFCVLYGS
jgi:hypothetical protein